MTELKVTSKKYNDKDELLVEGNIVFSEKLEDGSIKGVFKSLDVKEAVKSFTPSYYDSSARTRTGIYSKAVVTGGLLIIVCCDKWLNETDSTIPQSNIAITFEFDDEIGSKIYCYNGEKLSDAFTSQQRIAGFPYGTGLWLNNNMRSVIMKSGKNQLQITLSIPQLTAGSDTFSDGRVILGLL